MKTLKEKALLMKLSIGIWNAKRTDDKVTEQLISQHSASGNAGKFVKELVPRSTLENISKLTTRTRAHFYRHTLPWKDEGWRIVPSEKYLDMTQEIRKFKSDIDQQVQTFVEEFDSHVQKARNDLGTMFSEKDYPNLKELQSKFYVEVSFAPIPDHADFRVDTDDEVRQSIESQIKQAEKDCEKDLWNRLAEPLSRMVERLSSSENKFKDSLFENVNEVVELIPTLDIIGDPKLEEIRAQMQSHLTGINAEQVRKNGKLRKQTYDRATEIMNKMKEYMI